MAAIHPYKRFAANLSNSARIMYLVDPSDEEEMPRVCKALRIWNPSDSVAVIKVRLIEGAIVTLPIPPLSLWTEPAICDMVFETGTSPGLTIHAYTD